MAGLHESNVPCRLFVVPALIPLSSLCSGVSAFPVPVPPPFCFLGRTSFLCPMRFVPLTCVPLFSFCVFFVPVHPSFLLPCLLLFVVLSHSLPSPPCVPFHLCAFLVFLACARCFGASSLPVLSPSISPPPFSPLPSSFRCYPSPFLRSFPLLRFPLRKKFPLKSCMISSVKYMFYSIFLVCLGKFS